MTFSPARFDMDIWRNADFPDSTDDQWLIRDNGSPLNLTSKTLKMQVRLREGASGSALIDISSTPTTGDRIEKVNAAGGIFVIHIAKANLAALPAGPAVNPPDLSVQRFAYDLRVDNAVYVYGFLNVHTGVTTS